MNNAKSITLIIVLLFVLCITPVMAITKVAAGADLQATLVKYDPAPAEKGKLLTVWIKIENIGAEKAENAVFMLKPVYPFALLNANDSIKNYGSIRADSDVLLEYKLIVNKTAPKGTAHLLLSYTFGNDETEYEKEFSITIQDEPTEADLQVLFVETKPLAYPGAEITLTSDVVNVAPGNANYIIAQVESDIATITRNEIFVGTLEANDFDSVDVNMKIKPDVKPGKYPVKFTLRYKDADYEAKVVEDEILLNVVSIKQGLEEQSKADPILLAVELIVLLVFIRAIGMKFIKWFFKPFVKKWQTKKAQI